MDNTTIVEFSLLSDTARKPTKGSVNAAGHDLYSTCEEVILPGQRKLISTDICIKLPKCSYGRIAPRSGLAVKYCIDVHAGVIDADYRGKISVLLANMSNENFTVKVGDRIAQIIIEQIHDVTFVQTSQLDDTERGSNGFGSTGINTTEDVLLQKNTIVNTDNNKDDIQKKVTTKDDDDNYIQKKANIKDDDDDDNDIQKTATIKDDDDDDDDNDDIQKTTKDDMQNKSITTDDNDSKKKNDTNNNTKNDNSNTNATNNDPETNNNPKNNDDPDNETNDDPKTTNTTDPKTNADNNNSSDDDDYDDNFIDGDSNSELPRKRHRTQVSSDEEKLSIFEMFGMR